MGPIFWYHCHCLLTQETKIAEHNMIRATDRVEATLFIVQDVDELPERVKWAASLTGGWVAESSCFLRGQGMLLKYQKAIRTNYKLLLTDDFRERHPEMDRLNQSINSDLQTKKRLENCARNCQSTFRFVYGTKFGDAGWWAKSLPESVLSLPYLKA